MAHEELVELAQRLRRGGLLRRANLSGHLPAPEMFPTPSLIVNASITGNNLLGKKVTNGVTILGLVSGSVIVEAITTSTSNSDSGDIPGSIALGKFALRTQPYR